MKPDIDYFPDKFWQTDALDFVKTKNSLMKSVLNKIRMVAPTKSTVLLTGETGTGKGVLARLIHDHSNRKLNQFISVHCGAIPDTLLESELFGHEKGAFTGAVRKKLGKFEIAHGGSIFLDEIGTLTPSAQIKLLQVLQEGTFNRVGGEETITVDVRIISATNTDLKDMCEAGQFRKDLYYRLNVFPIQIPSLNQRPEDIPHLVDLFLKKLRRIEPKDIHQTHPVVMNFLIKYRWPGNIRELENTIERAYVLADSVMLEPKNFPGDIVDPDFSPTPMAGNYDSSRSLAEVRSRAVEVAERDYLAELLSQHKGKIRESAEAAGISTRQLSKLMAKYNLQKE
ncbi:MAG: sigma-54 dependent transcriptional regulator, partial [Proteobacteria bacterium]|nr:sigma-54 dependent transcriptional regulator [Pseudomonadota bacterium]